MGDPKRECEGRVSSRLSAADSSHVCSAKGYGYLIDSGSLYFWFLSPLLFFCFSSVAFSLPSKNMKKIEYHVPKPPPVVLEGSFFVMLPFCFCCL